MGNTYRPISFLCPAVEVLEGHLQPELNSLLFSPNQHGFRPNYSTVSALLLLAHKIAQGFNLPFPPIRTFSKSLDLTKAFNMINQTKLICALTLSSLRNNRKR